MIKKLRNRFVLLSMAFISIVMIFFYIVISGVLYIYITQSVQNTLKNYTSEDYLFQYYTLGEDNVVRSDAIDSSSICVVGINDVGTIALLDIGKGHIDPDKLDYFVHYVSNSDYEFGMLAKYNLFYYRADVGFGYRIAFADSSRYMTYLKEMLVTDAVLVVLTLAVFYVIIRLLSRIFIKPVQKAWTQQQNFIADASHELKTPLTVILANCDILHAHPDETVESQMKWINGTDEEATHMKELVEKMLFLAKNENMKPQKITEQVNISDLAMQIVLQFEPVAFEAGVELDSDIEDGIVITADSTSVNQIIHILVDNAVKYAGIAGKATLKLRRVKNTVYLSASNTGRPIPEEDLPHIFERFYRSDKARTAGTGYGLGLAICKSLAEQQNATIDVISDMTTGTEFTVKFNKQKPKKDTAEI